MTKILHDLSLNSTPQQWASALQSALPRIPVVTSGRSHTASTESSSASIEVSLDCSNQVALPFKIPVGKTAYIGFLNKRWPEHLPISLYQVTNIEGPRAKFWPDQAMMDYANKQAPGAKVYAARCDIVNHGGEDIAELTIPFKTSFWFGSPNNQYRKTTVVLGPIDKGMSTSFYLENDCPLVAAVAIPETGTARMICDETKQPFKLETINGQKIVAFGLGASPIVWSQTSCE
jgi:hypothetical protein